MQKLTAIDLERLIVRRTYLVPYGRDKILDRVITELNKNETFFDRGVPPWVYTTQGSSIEFSKNPEHNYLLLTVAPKDNYTDIVKEISKRREEFTKKSPSEHLKKIFSERRSGLPEELLIDIIDCDSHGCRVEVECRPLLYSRISQQGLREVDAISIQDARISCERYLKTIFISGLSSTQIYEKEPRTAMCKNLLLINDVSNHQIAEKTEEMLDRATGEVLIFAWIGTILLTKLRTLNEKGIKIRVITGETKSIRQDLAQKEKEKAFEEIISLIGKNNICVRRDFHGRAIIVDNTALIGSMDLDAYSLTGTRNEFAIYTEDPEIVIGLRNYFNSNFRPLKKEDSEKSSI